MKRSVVLALFCLGLAGVSGCSPDVDGSSGPSVGEGEADIAATTSLDKDSVTPGSNATLSFTVRNDGPTDVSDIPVSLKTDSGPGGSQWTTVVWRPDLTVSCTVEGDGSCSELAFLEDETGGQFEGFVTLASGESATYTLPLSFLYTTQGGEAPVVAEGCASVPEGVPDPDESNNCASAEAAIGERPEIVDYRDEIIYWAFTDRFANGDPGNDNGTGNRPDDEADPSNPRGWHGGDFAGLQQKVEEGYFQQMGFTTLWISPVVLQAPGVRAGDDPFPGYHGYWLENFDDPEPHFGSWAELQSLVATAQGQGLKVIIDIVANHTGRNAQIPVTEPDWFRIGAPGCDEQEEVDCSVAGLPDIRQEVAEARQWVLDGARNILLQSGADGFRIDTYKHVNPDFWYDFFAPGAPADRSTVFSVAENFTSSTQAIAEDLDFDGAPSVFDFPLYGAMAGSLARRESDTTSLATVFGNDSVYEDPTRLTTFIDNHDVPRFMTEALRNGATLTEAKERLSSALGVLYGARGIPSVYYGTEIAMRGGEDPDNRRDMMFPDPVTRMFANMRQKVTCGVVGSGDPAEAYGVPLFARGGFNDWADPPPDEAMFMNMGGNIYQAEFEAPAGYAEFKVAAADWSIEFVAPESEVPLDTPVALREITNLNASTILPRGGCYTFTLDVSDPEAPVLTIIEKIDENAKETCGVTGIGDPAEAYGAPIFVRGGFNDWGAVNQFENFGGNDYQAEFEIDPGAWEFKVASEDWSTDFTANGEVLIDTPVGLVPGGGAANSSVNLEEGGCFNFQLDVTDPAAPVLTLTEVPVIPTDEPVDLDLRERIAALAAARQGYEALRRGTQTIISAPGGACEPEQTGNDPTEAFGVEMFARGSFNDWADPPPATDGFANLGDGVYEARVTLGAGDERYKVAAGDWSVEFALIEAESGNTPLDTEVTMVPASGAGTEGQVSTAEAGCYSWRMDANDPAAPTLTISQLAGGAPTDVLAFQRDLEGAPSVVVVLNNEDTDVDLGTLGSGGIPVTLADGAVTELTGAETDLAVAGGLLTGTIPARSTLLVSDQ